MTLLTEDVDRTRVVVTEGRRSPRLPDRARQTVHRIVAGNITALLALIAIGYAVGAQLAEQQALADASRLTRFVADVAVAPQFGEGLATGEPHAREALDRAFVDGGVATTSIARIKVWSSDGTVLYSDEHSEIGRTYPLSDDERALLAGRDDASAKVSGLDGAENAAERALGARMLEVYVPLVVDGRTYLVEAYIDYDDLVERRGAVFGSLAILAGVLVVLALLAQFGLAHANLRWLRRRQADLDQACREISDLERRRVARDLHDGAVQELLGLSLLTDGAAATLVRGDLEATRRTLDQCSACIGSAVQALRSSIVEIYPAVLADRGLPAALEDLAQPLRSRGVSVDVDVTGDDSLDPELTTACYRAAQELLRNVRRHADASHVTVTVRADGDGVRLTVADDGRGIAPERLARAHGADGHLGLAGLADTALERDGRLVVTAAGRGTEVTWEARS